jgi:predicted membrane channel-forming protein YqfA (hemolysin III family)
MNNHVINLLFGCFYLLAACSVAFWIVILVKALQMPSGSDKIVWVLVVIFAGIIGAIIFVIIRPDRTKQENDRLTSAERDFLREFENGPGRRPKVVLTPDEERMLAEYRRAYRGDP